MIHWAKRLLFRLWKGCNTGCNGCSDNYIPQEKYQMSKIKKNIDVAFHVFQNDFDILFFWVDPLCHHNIDELIKYVDWLHPRHWIGVQISDMDNYTNETYRLLRLLLEYPQFKVYISTSTKNLDNYALKSLVKLLNFFSKNYHERISIQIYYNKKQDLLQSKNFILLSKYKNIDLSISDAVKVHHDLQRVTNEDTFCKYHNAFMFENNEIFLKEIAWYYDLEVAFNGDIRPHIPRCYLADIKISNIFFDTAKRVADFRYFDRFLTLTYNRQKTFEHNCYNCIIHEKHSYQTSYIWK